MNFLTVAFVSLFAMIGLSMIHCGGYPNYQQYSYGNNYNYGGGNNALYVPYNYYVPADGFNGGGVGSGGFLGDDGSGLFFLFFLMIILFANNNSG